MSFYFITFPQPVLGQTTTHTVKSGDTLWIIAQRYQVGLSEIIGVNPQFKNPNLIYPGQKVYISQLSGTKSIEEQVISLTNVERQ